MNNEFRKLMNAKKNEKQDFIQETWSKSNKLSHRNFPLSTEGVYEASGGRFEANGEMRDQRMPQTAVPVINQLLIDIHSGVGKGGYI